MPADVCLNCGSAATARFCASCGQRTVPAYPTVRQFAGDACAEFFGYDGRLLRTLRDLARPGQLTVDTMEGRRACHVGALRLYLSASLIYFLIAAAAPNIGASRATIPGAEEIRIDLNDPRGKGGLTPAQLAQARKNIEDAPRILKPIFETVLNDPGGFRNKMLERMPRVLFALVPVLAALLSLLYRRRPFTQHLIFALHLQTVIFVVLSVAELAKFTGSLGILAGVNIVAWLGLASYGIAALRRVYGGSWPKTVLKGGALGVMFVVAWLVAMVALLVWTVWL